MDKNKIFVPRHKYARVFPRKTHFTLKHSMKMPLQTNIFTFIITYSGLQNKFCIAPAICYLPNTNNSLH